MKHFHTMLLTTAIALSQQSITAQSVTQTFSYTGGMQSFTVPSCVSSMTVQLIGAQGGSQGAGGTGGLGGYVGGVINVTAGQVINIFVGGQNGYNGGGAGGSDGNTVLNGPSIGSANNGGGASDIRIGGIALTDRVMVAGGGGGAAHEGVWPGCTNAGPAGNGGTGGALLAGNGTGGSSSSCNCGGGGGNGGVGGSNAIGGAAGTYNNMGCLQQPWAIGNVGALGLGGAGSSVFHNGTGGGGGGGGGYYGGGSGANGSDTTPGGGGGGGSSYTGIATNTVNTSGLQNGDGQISFTYISGNGASISVNSGSICSGQSFTITPSGAVTYTFETGNPVVSPATSTNYTVIGTDNTGCLTNIATSTITVIASPTLQIASGSGTVCAGFPINITASGATTYLWNTGATTSSILPNPTSDTSYTVTGTSNNCSADAIVTITVAPAPALSVSGPTLICPRQSVTLTVSGATSYSWSTGATSPAIAINPTISTSYVVSGTLNATGCTNMTTVAVVVNPCTGLAEVENKIAGLFIYPNPSDGKFTVELNDASEKIIEVLDVTGKKVYAVTSLQEKVDVNIADLANGIYYLKVQSNSAVEVIKIVKK